MDDGQRWAIETFGEHGPYIRARILRLVQDEHTASADAQEASGHRSQGVYGQFYRGILERFEEFKDLLGACLVRPGSAPYKIPVVGGVAIFPWRHGRTRRADATDEVFATSDARRSLLWLPVPTNLQAELFSNAPEPTLTDEEQEFLKELEAVATHEQVTTNKVVVVGVSSSPRTLHSVVWGEVDHLLNGRLVWGFNEHILDSDPHRPMPPAAKDRTFTTGDIPSKSIKLRSEVDSRPEASDGTDD